VSIAPDTLPTGGKVAAGVATIATANTSGKAVLEVDQTSQRAEDP
jgi:hypothetical protein